MANLKDLKKSIRSIKNTSKTTKAMKMVSAAKLRRAKAQLDSLHPYFHTLQGQGARLLALDSSEIDKNLFNTPVLAESKELLIVIGGDKGLCGSYNSSVFKLLNNYMNQKKSAGELLDVITIGKKINDVMRSRKLTSSKSLDDFWKRKLNSTTAEAFFKEMIWGAVESGEYNKISVLYTHFKSAISTKAQVVQLYPLSEVEFENANKEVDLNPGVIEPNEQVLSSMVFDQYLRSKFFYHLLNSQASEHGSRMASMDNATRNAKEMTEQLTLTYNRLRQEAITKELIDIVGGAEAV